jgi:hypothetical protein
VIHEKVEGPVLKFCTHIQITIPEKRAEEQMLHKNMCERKVKIRKNGPEHFVSFGSRAAGTGSYQEKAEPLSFFMQPRDHSTLNIEATVVM